MRRVLTIAAITAPPKAGTDSGSPPAPGAPHTRRLSVASTITTATNYEVPNVPGAPPSATPVPRPMTRRYEGGAA
jgi:hypothetical protein